MKPKYVICPGFVTSKTDGQRHYVGPYELMRLYGVDPKDCDIYEPTPWWPGSVSVWRPDEEHKGLIRLHPRYDGDYKLPSDHA